MDTAAKELLQTIGNQLDHQIFPLVKNGGIVAPSESAVPSTLGEEKCYGHKRNAIRSEKATPGGKGSAGGSWSPRQTAPVIGASLQARYEDELDAVHRAYPGTKVWRQDDGLWLLTESALLTGLREAAIFLTGISYSRAIVRGWGFWRGALGNLTWIGPRHTNFPDGSVCAYQPSDGTWAPGDHIVALLDLYTVWALRHLHLEVFNRWPGPQAVFHPYERILESREEEHCGCGQFHKRYGECCQAKDLARNRIADAINFFVLTGGGIREPPSVIVRSVRDQSEPPQISNLLC